MPRSPKFIDDELISIVMKARTAMHRKGKVLSRKNYEEWKSYVSQALDTIQYASRKPEDIDFGNSMKLKYTHYDVPSETEINDIFEPYLPMLRLVK